MPFYEYRCENCGHELEELQKLSDAPLRDCPECDSASLKKKVSAAGFRLKGSGWYETDFKSGKKKNLAGSDGKEAPKSGGSNSTTADSATKKTG